MSQEKKQQDFSNLDEREAVSMVTASAVVAKNSGHGVVVRHASIGGQRGIMVFMPGYEMSNGNVTKIKDEPAGIHKVDINKNPVTAKKEPA